MTLRDIPRAFTRIDAPRKRLVSLAANANRQRSRQSVRQRGLLVARSSGVNVRPCGGGALHCRAAASEMADVTAAATHQITVATVVGVDVMTPHKRPCSKQPAT